MTLHVPRELLARHATSAPRYTSYPTAADWSKDFDSTQYPALLARAARTRESLSVYVHLPFCAELCLFCGCNVIVSRSKTRADTYVDALEKEFAFVDATGVGARRVRQYHWGGGTPTQLTLDQMERVQAAFRSTFTLDDDAEVAVEVDPRVTTREKVEWLARSGFNRVSLGVQDFEPAVQQAIKRIQSEEQTRAVIDAARENGIGSINVDLIYGLPEQTAKGFEHTIDRVIAIRPERVALFHYAHVPWMKKHQNALETDRAPSSEDKLTIFTRAIEQFEGAGYVYIGLDHFALPTDELARALADKKLQRNFMGYTTRRGSDMVSLGVSAIGDVSGSFVQNASTEADYLRLIDERGYATFRGHALSHEDALRREVIVGLMCNGILEKRTIERRHGIDFDTTFAAELAALAPLAADGLVRLDADAIHLTDLGQVFMRNVALPFDRYYAERMAKGGDTGRTFSKTL